MSQSSRYQVIAPGFTRRNLTPPMIPPLPFQASGASSLLYEEEQAPMSSKPTIRTNSLMQADDDAILGQYSRSNILSSPVESEFPSPSFTAKTPAHAGISSSRLNSRQYSIDSPLATSPSEQDLIPNWDSILLERQLQSVLDTVLTIKKQLQTSSSAKILTPEAQNILGRVNALVSTETSVPVTSTGTWRSRYGSSCELLYSHP
jgi:hypothetical protein